MIAWLSEPSAAVTAASGGKGACLSRMARAGLPVPPGFVVCADAFQDYLARSDVAGRIAAALRAIDAADEASMDATARTIRDLIFSNRVPEAVSEGIRAAYGALGTGAPVAIRSSAICEDGESASFAGQQETFLNVRGPENVIERVKNAGALFSLRELCFIALRRAILPIRAWPSLYNK